MCLYAGAKEPWVEGAVGVDAITGRAAFNQQALPFSCARPSFFLGHPQDCGHDDAHTPSLFDPTPLSRRATNAAGPCLANSADTCLPNVSAVAYTAADARPRPCRRDAVTVVAYDDAMLLHQESEACPSSGGGAHPERPDRLRAVWARLQAAELAGGYF